MKKLGEKIVVGMSGGVDSSMSLIMLKKQGWQPIGVSLKFGVWQDKRNFLQENICCSQESFKIAKNICQKVGAPHYIFDVSKEFKKEVIDYFISELKNNRTPNPCVVCNPKLKFKKLFEWAHKHKIKYVATGHYAKTKRNSKTGEYELLRGQDKGKDQTYPLSFLPEKWLKYVVFPLGNQTKDETFELAKKEGFSFFLKKKQSQDFCFVTNKCLNCFLEKEIGKKAGVIKNISGEKLGKHQGLHFYTLGQRKGINIQNGPYFVTNKISKDNALVVSKKEKDLLAKEAWLSPFNLNLKSGIKKSIQIKVKIRSQHPLVKAVLVPINSKKIKIVFNQPQKSVTPGQFAVFYQKKACLGGGRIIKAK